MSVQAGYHKLSMQDAAFLYAETPSMPMNIGSVQNFRPPERDTAASQVGELFFQRLRVKLARCAPAIRFMSCKLKTTPFAVDHPVWVIDKDFSIDQHLEKIQLTGKGSQRQLERRIAELHEVLLPRDRPLWKYYLFEGLHDGTLVLYEKYHHACFDGVAGQQVIELLFTQGPEDRQPLVEAGELTLTAEEPGASTLLVDAGTQLIKQSINGVRTFPSMIGAASRLLQNSLSFALMDNRRVARTPLNRALSPYRSWTCASLSLTEVKAVAKHNGCTVNDLFLALCSTALKRYLERHDALPDEALVCGVPVSLRRDSDAVMANRVGMLVASLATNKQNPLNRLAAIKSSMRAGKKLLVNSAALAPDDFHMPGIGGILSFASTLNRVSRFANRVPPPVNLIVSNVPGPQTTRYLCGAQLLTHYPVSIPGEGLALNITCQSYVDRLDVGFTACLEAVPDLHLVRNDFLHAFREYKAIFEIDLEGQADRESPESYSRSGSMTA